MIMATPKQLTEAKKLWGQLGNVPVNDEDDTIDEQFLDFEPGTPKEDVWHWFEEEFDLSVAEDLMMLKK